MENGTKALLIAASVLIVIILITIGIKILSSSDDVVNQLERNSSSLASSAFNAQFTQYFGSDVSWVQACALVSKIMINNAQNPDLEVRVCLRKPKGTTNSDGEIKEKLIYAHDQNTFNERQQALQKIHDNIEQNKNITYSIDVTTSCNFANKGAGYSNGYIICITIYQNSNA